MTWALYFRKTTRQVCIRWAENGLGAGDPGVKGTDPEMAQSVLAKRRGSSGHHLPTRPRKSSFQGIRRGVLNPSHASAFIGADTETAGLN